MERDKRRDSLERGNRYMISTNYRPPLLIRHQSGANRANDDPSDFSHVIEKTAASQFTDSSLAHRRHFKSRVVISTMAANNNVVVIGYVIV